MRAAPFALVSRHPEDARLRYVVRASRLATPLVAASEAAPCAALASRTGL